MLAQAEAVAADADDVAVVQEAVDEGRGHDLVAEHGAVLADGEVVDLVDHQRRGVGRQADPPREVSGCAGFQERFDQAG